MPVQGWTKKAIQLWIMKNPTNRFDHGLKKKTIKQPLSIVIVPRILKEKSKLKLRKYPWKQRKICEFGLRCFWLLFILLKAIGAEKRNDWASIICENNGELDFFCSLAYSYGNRVLVLIAVDERTSIIILPLFSLFPFLFFFLSLSLFPWQKLQWIPNLRSHSFALIEFHEKELFVKILIFFSHSISNWTTSEISRLIFMHLSFCLSTYTMWNHAKDREASSVRWCFIESKTRCFLKIKNNSHVWPSTYGRFKKCFSHAREQIVYIFFQG